MEEIGVQAVVKGLSSFLADLGKISTGLKGLQNSLPKGNLFTDIFTGAGNALKSFGREVLNVAEFALGQLLANSIQFITQKIGELATATVETGSEFQLMEMRLQRLNFNEVVGQTLGLASAQKLATEATKDQLQWVLRLAATTPYDAQDIANVYTLARSYGFVGDNAKQLTQDISNFASGMGLGNTEIERIIVNFGQMVQQGKVTQREMNDLARGAFVPVNDVMAKMRQNVSQMSQEDLKALSKATGISSQALKNIAQDTKAADSTFTKLRATGEGVTLFMQAFSDVVEQRFTGAAEQMARTFKGATDNAQDFIKSIFGFNVVKPVLDLIGGKIGDMLSALTAPENFEKVSGAAANLGNAITGLVSDLLGLKSFDAASFVDGFVTGLNNISDWINSNKGNVVDFFTGIGTAIQTQVVPFIQNVVGAFDTISAWVSSNGETINGFFSALGEIISTVFADLTGGQIQIGGGLEGFLTGITSFMQYVITNKESIAEFVSDLTRLFVIVQAVSFVFGILGSILISVVTFVISVIAGVSGLIGVISVLSAVVGALLSPLGLIVVIVGAVIGIFLSLGAVAFMVGQAIGAGLLIAVAAIKTFAIYATIGFNQFKAAVMSAMSDAVATVNAKIGEFKSAGQNMIQGMVNGVTSAAGRLASAIRQAVQNAINAALSVLDSHSPSRVFMEIGENTMKGMALGIQDMAGMVEGAMQGVVAQATLPALAMPAVVQNYAMAASSVPSATYNTTNNMNLTINSAARTEQVMQDYNTMRALIGA